jgi:hypothetical protein
VHNVHRQLENCAELHHKKFRNAAILQNSAKLAYFNLPVE